jgi:hypothetical protein
MRLRRLQTRYGVLIQHDPDCEGDVDLGEESEPLITNILESEDRNPKVYYGECDECGQTIINLVNEPFFFESSYDYIGLMDEAEANAYEAKIQLKQKVETAQ